ncbi:phage baseplate assembly protein V [Streptomyces sp. NPDC002922]|uniref:phage baseplate assembly protein V n=1 Tax=Streptomyces sp. NPDC002922 TaxID=3154439 RepID=UPI0033B29814
MTPLYGTFSAIVVDAHDPQNRGRARLRIPQVMGTAVSGWAEPVVLGAVLPGDQVYVSFDGGDRNFPVFWPKVRAGLRGWVPLTMAAGWVADTSVDGPPAARLTGDGMIELQGVARTTDGSVPVATSDQTICTLPDGIRPLYRVFGMGAGSAAASNGAQSASASRGLRGTTTSTTYVSTLTSDATAVTVSFVSPASGRVNVMLGANIINTNDLRWSYMSFGVSLGGTQIVAPDNDSALYKAKTGDTSVASSFPVSGLLGGSTYTATLWYQTSNADNTVTYDNRILRVDPVMPGSELGVRIAVNQDGTIRARYPYSTGSSFVSLGGVRARAM